MTIDTFYSSNPIQSWKKILGDSLHYHFGTTNDQGIDIMEYTITNLYRFIEPHSKILDCGCGWGAPALQLRKDLECDIMGVTISTSQYNYIKKCVKEINVVYADLHEYKPRVNYDVALFVESYTHLTNPRQVLSNLYENVNSLVIRDFVSSCEHMIPDWNMKIRTKQMFVDDITSSGYEIIHFETIKDFYLPAIQYWLNNAKKLELLEIYGQIEKLIKLCVRAYEMNKRKIDNHYDRICIIHAKKMP
jgi:hypothetical protein